MPYPEEKKGTESNKRPSAAQVQVDSLIQRISDGQDNEAVSSGKQPCLQHTKKARPFTAGQNLGGAQRGSRPAGSGILQDNTTLMKTNANNN